MCGQLPELFDNCRWRDGSFARRLSQCGSAGLLVIGGFAISPMGAPERNDLLELLDDRIGTRSHADLWLIGIGTPSTTDADAILDRVVTASHKIALKATAKSMRERTVGTWRGLKIWR
jgi:DNA replication protein DnaC